MNPNCPRCDIPLTWRSELSLFECDQCGCCPETRANQWISVKEQLPSTDREVVIFWRMPTNLDRPGQGYQEFVSYRAGAWVTKSGMKHSRVTHWSEKLPEPEEAKDAG